MFDSHILWCTCGQVKLTLNKILVSEKKCKKSFLKKSKAWSRIRLALFSHILRSKSSPTIRLRRLGHPHLRQKSDVSQFHVPQVRMYPHISKRAGGLHKCNANRGNYKKKRKNRILSTDFHRETSWNLQQSHQTQRSKGTLERIFSPLES